MTGNSSLPLASNSVEALVPVATPRRPSGSTVTSAPSTSEPTRAPESWVRTIAGVRSSAAPSAPGATVDTATKLAVPCSRAVRPGPAARRAVCVHSVPPAPSTLVSVTPSSRTPSPPGSATASTNTPPDADTHTRAGASTRPTCLPTTAPSTNPSRVTSRVEEKHHRPASRSKPHAARPARGRIQAVAPLLRLRART